MTYRDSALTLRQMLDYAREAIALSAGKQRSDVDTDRLLELALTRLLEIIGEAANRVPVEIQTQHPVIPWAQIISLRNRLIHGYDAVDFDILWQIIVQDLPLLATALAEIIGD